MDVDNCALNLIKLEYHDSLSLGKQAHPMTNELIPATMHPTKPKLTSTVAKGTSEKDYVTFSKIIKIFHLDSIISFQIFYLMQSSHFVGER